MYYIINNNNVMISGNIEILKSYNLPINELPYDYENGKYIVVNEKLVINPNWEEEQKQKEKERIKNLSLTKREVFLALYKAKKITPDVLKAKITNTEALIEFEYANEYFRGNSLIDSIGGMLGYTSDDLDYLFINKELPKQLESEEK